MRADLNQMTEVKPHLFATEASDLGIRAGVPFPKTLATNVGNGQPLVAYTKKIDNEGDLLYVRYRQRLGCVDVLVYND